MKSILAIGAIALALVAAPFTAEAIGKNEKGCLAGGAIGGVGGAVLGNVDVHHRVQFTAQVSGLPDRVVGDRERRVQSDDAADQRAAVRSDEASTFRQAAHGLLASAVAPDGTEVAVVLIELAVNDG